MAGDADWMARERARWRSFVRRRPERVEIPGPGQESVWDYPRPPRVEPVKARVRVELAGEVLAESTRAVRVCETASPPVYYLPPEDVRTDLLAPSAHTSFCEWKGRARYWDARVAGEGGERRVRHVAFSYPTPDAGFEAIRDHLGFYPGRVDGCFVGDDRVRPQPGEFYAGWITPNLTGPFKGEPGTEGW